MGNMISELKKGFALSLPTLFTAEQHTYCHYYHITGTLSKFKNSAIYYKFLLINPFLPHSMTYFT